MCDLTELSGYSDCGNSVTRTTFYFLPDNLGPAIQRLAIDAVDISTMSWFEYTLLKQAKEWDLKMSIGPAPESDAEREFECSGEASTFVDKNEYEKPLAMPDASRPGDTDTDVKSPANALDITITGE